MAFSWVSSADVPIFEHSDETSKKIDVLEPGTHFGKCGHDHYGHRVVILQERRGWQRVMTCLDVIGWTRSGILVNTLEFCGQTLASPAAQQDKGNDGPRIVLFHAHLYMSNAEIRKELEMLRANPDAARVFLGLLDREVAGMNFARQLWDQFNAIHLRLTPRV